MGTAFTVADGRTMQCVLLSCTLEDRMILLTNLTMINSMRKMDC